VSVPTVIHEPAESWLVAVVLVCTGWVSMAAAADPITEAEATAILAPVKDQPFIAFHDAYGYYVAHYGLTLEGTVALGDASAPGAARLAEIRDLAEHGAVCIFPEVQHDPKMVETIVADTGVKQGGALDPTGSSMEPGPDLYPAVLSTMADTLVACLKP